MVIPSTAHLEYPDAGTPCCLNCGFLGFWSSGSQLGGRDEWYVADGGHRTLWLIPAMPECWKHVDLTSETMDQGGMYAFAAGHEPETARVIRQVIEKHRPECADKWHPWTRNWSLRDHVEEHKVFLLEESRRRWEKDLEDSRMVFQERIETAANASQERIAKQADKTQKKIADSATLTVRIAIVSLIVGVVLGVVSLWHDRLIPTPAMQSTPSTASPRQTATP